VFDNILRNVSELCVIAFRGGRITDGWPEVRASRSVIARKRARTRERERERKEPSRILLAGEFVTHELASRVKLCRKKSESTFFPLSLMTTNTSANNCVRFVARIALKTSAMSASKSLSFLPLPRKTARMSWFWLERRHTLLRIARVFLNENYHPSGKSHCQNTFISHNDTV